jgi:peroxiredoxin Q/BCP
VKAGAAVYGVSRDSLRSHENFKAKMGFPFDLLSDESEKVCEQFGVMKMKNMYGRKVRGIERSTFVIDRDRVIRREWRGVKVPGHAQEVLDFVEAD